MILVWFDNCTFYAKEANEIDAVITSLKDKLLIEREEDLAGFLRIHIDRNKN